MTIDGVGGVGWIEMEGTHHTTYHRILLSSSPTLSAACTYAFRTCVCALVAFHSQIHMIAV